MEAITVTHKLFQKLFNIVFENMKYRMVASMRISVSSATFNAKRSGIKLNKWFLNKLAPNKSRDATFIEIAR